MKKQILLITELLITFFILEYYKDLCLYPHSTLNLRISVLFLIMALMVLIFWVSFQLKMSLVHYTTVAAFLYLFAKQLLWRQIELSKIFKISFNTAQYVMVLFSHDYKTCNYNISTLYRNVLCDKYSEKPQNRKYSYDVTLFMYITSFLKASIQDLRKIITKYDE